jgi:histidinol dehydrogenase
MLRSYRLDEAQNTILKRVPLDDMDVPQSILDRLRELFKEAVTPDQAVQRILRDVRLRGDAALIEWSRLLDGSAHARFRVPTAALRDALEQLPAPQREALELAAGRIRRFHQAQPVTSWMTNQLGGTLGQYVRPIQRIGIYVPGGSAPLPSTVLMSAIPAQVAGVREIVVAAPPQHGAEAIAPVILAACALAGVEEVYTIGGAQAIAALAFGTQSIPAVDKIFGPGSLFVTLAKRQVFGVVGIDGLAGPTETMVIADESANAEWVAADLLAQAEHDVLASAILLSPSAELIARVQAAAARQIEQRGRAGIIVQSLANRSGAVLTRDLDEAVDIANTYAPEHLCLAVRDPWRLAERVHAAGGIFLGEHSFEVLGDYVAGPSHVMPTGGSARFASPLNVVDFVHRISIVALDERTTREIVPAAVEIALAEGLDAHAYSAQVRI